MAISKTALLAATLACVGCASNHQEHRENVAVSETSTNDPSLSQQLSDYRDGFSQRAPQDMQDLFQARIDDLKDSGIVGDAKNVGDAAPLFTLQSASGETVALQDLLADGPVILNWYRGGWCPYCNLALRAYQSRLDEITAAGATFVAITPETPDNSLSTSEKNELAYPVVSDPGNAVAREYGLVFRLADDLATIYNDRFDLNGYNGDTSNELPLAATYIIDTDGTIRYAFLSSDYRDRAEPAEVIDALKTLTNNEQS